MLAIENPDGSLHFSAQAVGAAAAHFEQPTVLRGKAADKIAVLAQLPRHSVTYFFTHGIANFNEPLQSGLLLGNDEWLTLAQLYDVQMPQVQLAVLAACESGAPADFSALDEAVSLPGGLLEAGVPAVVGVAWLWLAYRLMLPVARNYADLIEAAFDLYRWELYKHLHLPLPVDSAGEVAQGKQLSELIWRGPVREAITYVHPDK
ncbi:MAG: CHAT domain-containing protein [Anaerolineae bacterium]